MSYLYFVSSAGHIMSKCPDLETAQQSIAAKKDASKRVAIFTTHPDDDRDVFITQIDIHANENLSVADIYARRSHLSY